MWFSCKKLELADMCPRSIFPKFQAIFFVFSSMLHRDAHVRCGHSDLPNKRKSAIGHFYRAAPVASQPVFIHNFWRQNTSNIRQNDARRVVLRRSRCPAHLLEALEGCEHGLQAARGDAQRERPAHAEARHVELHYLRAPDRATHLYLCTIYPPFLASRPVFIHHV